MRQTTTTTKIQQYIKKKQIEYFMYSLRENEIWLCEIKEEN